MAHAAAFVVGFLYSLLCGWSSKQLPNHWSPLGKVVGLFPLHLAAFLALLGAFKLGLLSANPGVGFAGMAGIAVGFGCLVVSAQKKRTDETSAG